MWAADSMLTVALTASPRTLPSAARCPQTAPEVSRWSGHSGRKAQRGFPNECLRPRGVYCSIQVAGWAWEKEAQIK